MVVIFALLLGKRLIMVPFRQLNSPILFQKVPPEMCTLIGTSTNLWYCMILDAGYKGFDSMFELGRVGIFIALQELFICCFSSGCCRRFGKTR